MASMVTIDLKGIPLATTLKLTLDQLGLAYWIHPDGLLVITSKENPRTFPSTPMDADPERALGAPGRESRSSARRSGSSRGMPASAGCTPAPLQLPAESKPQGGMGAKGGMM